MHQASVNRRVSLYCSVLAVFCALLTLLNTFPRYIYFGQGYFYAETRNDLAGFVFFSARAFYCHRVSV